MSKLDSQALRVMAQDIEEALRAVAEKHSLVITTGKIKYSDFTADIVLKVALQTGDSEEPLDVYALEYKQFAHLFSLQQEWLFQTYRAANGTTYKVVGLKYANRRYPVICESETGKRYKMTEDQIKQAFA